MDAFAARTHIAPERNVAVRRRDDRTAAPALAVTEAAKDFIRFGSRVAWAVDDWGRTRHFPGRPG
jgi:hypothetical protein